MEPIILVGRNLGAVLASEVLKKSNLPFLTADAGESLWMGEGYGNLRFRKKECADFFKELFGSEMESVEAPPKERKAGNWLEFAATEKGSEELFVAENALEGNSQPIDDKLSDLFSENLKITSVKPDEQLVECSDGKSIQYSQLLWCDSLESLSKIWIGDKNVLIKCGKKLEELQGGVRFDLETKVALINSSATVAFSFRYKDRKLRALGTEQKKGALWAIHWLLVLDRDLLEDKEEVAKVTRALKRELFKEFSELKTATVSERIVFLPKIATHRPLYTESLRLAPHVFYLGNELTEAPEESKGLLLDVVVENCKAWATQPNA